MPDLVVWADLPVTDLQRASDFYSRVLGEPVTAMPGADGVAVIGNPAEGGPPRVSMDLYVGGKPSHEGATVYFGTNGDIDGMLARVGEAGGKVLDDKKFMGPMVGWIAFIEDTEGNRVGFQQPGSGDEA